MDVLGKLLLSQNPPTLLFMCLYVYSAYLIIWKLILLADLDFY